MKQCCGYRPLHTLASELASFSLCRLLIDGDGSLNGGAFSNPWYVLYACGLLGFALWAYMTVDFDIEGSCDCLEAIMCFDVTNSIFTSVLLVLQLFHFLQLSRIFI